MRVFIMGLFAAICYGAGIFVICELLFARVLSFGGHVSDKRAAKAVPAVLEVKRVQPMTHGVERYEAEYSYEQNGKRKRLCFDVAGDPPASLSVVPGIFPAVTGEGSGRVCLKNSSSFFNQKGFMPRLLLFAVLPACAALLIMGVMTFIF